MIIRSNNDNNNNNDNNDNNSNYCSNAKSIRPRAARPRLQQSGSTSVLLLLFSYGVDCILWHSVRFGCILLHSVLFSVVFGCILFHSVVFRIVFRIVLRIVYYRILLHSAILCCIQLSYVAFSYIMLYVAIFCCD
jgi:hypothetical protein